MAPRHESGGAVRAPRSTRLRGIPPARRCSRTADRGRSRRWQRTLPAGSPRAQPFRSRIERAMRCAIWISAGSPCTTANRASRRSHQAPCCAWKLSRSVSAGMGSNTRKASVGRLAIRAAMAGRSKCSRPVVLMPTPTVPTQCSTPDPVCTRIRISGTYSAQRSLTYRKPRPLGGHPAGPRCNRNPLDANRRRWRVPQRTSSWRKNLRLHWRACGYRLS